jgi:hypothetical protein
LDDDCFKPQYYLKKLDQSRGRNIEPDLISCFGAIFGVSWVDKLVSRCCEGVYEISFLLKYIKKEDVFGKNISILIF